MTKLIVKICYKLLYVILGVKSIFDEVRWPSDKANRENML